MGNCCFNQSNKQKISSNIRLPKNLKAIPSSKNTLHQITLQEVENDINKWVETTKRNHKKSFSASQNSVTLFNNKKEMYSLNESSISKDFCDDNDMVKTFSELTSTIHLTNLTKEIGVSKKPQKISSINGSQSLTLFNILEELEENLPSTQATPEVKFFISRNYHDSNSKINNQMQSGVNIIINRTSGSEDYTDTKEINDNAQIYSKALCTSNDNKNDESDDGLNVDDVFFNIEKKKFSDLNKQIVQSYGSSSEDIFYSNGVVLNPDTELCNFERKSDVNYCDFNIGNDLVSWVRVYKEIPEASVSEISSEMINDFAIWQNKVKNSSLLSALVGVVVHDLNFKTKLLDSIVQKDDDESFLVRIFFNGRLNKIYIEDKLPTINKKCIFSLCNVGSLAPKIHLIEKVFFLMNSCNLEYSSNFSIELYHLIGWLPEFYSLSLNKINKDYFWNNFYNNFIIGNLMVCFANKENPDESTDKNGILTKENVYMNIYYPVVSAKKNKNLILKNTYGGLNPKKGKNLNNSGTFEISFEYAFDIFTHVYFCWNPSVYQNSYTVKGTIDRRINTGCEKSLNEDYCVENNPQFVIKIPPHKDDIEIRMMLIKHTKILNTKAKISYKLYKYEGYPIIYSDGSLREIPKGDKEITSDVICFESSKTEDEYVIVILKCDDTFQESNFTLSLFSEIQIEVAEIPKRKKYLMKGVGDNWSISNNIQNDLLYHTFLLFPQFTLSLNNSKSLVNHIQLILETRALSNIMLCVIEGDKSLFHVSAEKFMERKTPNYFGRSFSYLELKIPNGKYLVLCLSSIESNSGRMSNLQNFSLVVKSLSPLTEKISLVRLHPLPKYTHIERLFGEWNRKNNRWTSSSMLLMLKNPCYEFSIKSPTKCYFYLREANSNKNFDFSSNPHIFLSLVKVEEGKYHIVFNGESKPCSFWGFLIEDIELLPGKYILLCMNFIRYEKMRFEVTIHHNIPFNGSIKQFLYVQPRKNSYDIYSSWNGDINKTNKYKIKNLFENNVCDFEIIASDSTSIGLLVTEEVNNEIKIDKKKIMLNEDIFVIKSLPLKAKTEYYLIPYSLQKKKFNIDITINSEKEVKITEKNIIVNFI